MALFIGSNLGLFLVRIADADPDAELSIVVLKNVYDAQVGFALFFCDFQ